MRATRDSADRCRDRIGHPFWSRDFYQTHAELTIRRAKALGKERFWHGEPPAQVSLEWLMYNPPVERPESPGKTVR
jgi:hypothetical protein